MIRAFVNSTLSHHLMVVYAFLLAMATLLIATPATTQTDAFSVEVAISDRSEVQKREAFKLALRQVLLANSGDKTLLNRTDVRNGVRDAESFVEQFRYRVPEPGTVIDRDTPVTDRVRKSGEATQLMLVRFDRDRIGALIEGDAAEVDDTSPDAAERDSAIVAEPTSALVWMLVEDGPRDILVTGDNVINVQRRAIEIAGGAGFSLRFPAGDELDAMTIGVDDLRIMPALAAARRDGSPPGSGKPGERFATDRTRSTGEADGADAAGAGTATVPEDASGLPGTNGTDERLTPMQRLLRASERYVETRILIGHIQKQPLRGWKSAWKRIDIPRGKPAGQAGGARQSGEQAADEAAASSSETDFTSESLDEALQSGLGWLIPALDSMPVQASDDRFSSERSTTEALVWISSLDTTKSYAQTLAFLGEIDGVTTVYPKLASADGMIFSLSPRNALSNLNAALPRVSWLRPIATPQVASKSRLGRNTELALDYIGPSGN